MLVESYIKQFCVCCFQGATGIAPTEAMQKMKIQEESPGSSVASSVASSRASSGSRGSPNGSTASAAAR